VCRQDRGRPTPLRAVGVFEVCQAFALPDEVAHECVAHIVGQCDEDDDASGGVSGCGNADDRAVAVDVMAAREPEIGPRLDADEEPPQRLKSPHLFNMDGRHCFPKPHQGRRRSSGSVVA
jgi:hypothetical protein